MFVVFSLRLGVFARDDLIFYFGLRSNFRSKSYIVGRDEVNLRFYVRRRGPEGWRRGVVFIKELVPRWAIATVARVVYNENYRSVPMRHHIEMNPAGSEGSATYEWRWQGQWARMHVAVHGTPALPDAGAEATFITEHYWGYARQRDGRTLAYQVAHPQWRVWPAETSSFDCDVATLYGPAFVDPLAGGPSSAFLADGSAVTVFSGVPLAPGG